jgi:hypothetical protein
MTKYGAGSYIACGTCGRLLRIVWATRSIVCSCGARITSARAVPAPDPPPPGGKR